MADNRDKIIDTALRHLLRVGFTRSQALSVLDAATATEQYEVIEVSETEFIVRVKR